MNDPHDRVALRAGIPRFYVMNVWLAAAERQRTHGDLVNLSPGGWGGCWCRKFAGERAVAELQRIADAPRANEKYRVSVLLANDEAEQTLTITHVLWAMFGLLPEGQVQRPHRHQSVALDLILDCQPGCYSLLGDRLDDRGNIVNPIRVDWQPGGAFVTPPRKWHAHYNESGAPAHLIPVQDAGLHTHLRSLDIRFTDRR